MEACAGAAVVHVLGEFLIHVGGVESENVAGFCNKIFGSVGFIFKY